jgi:hypothetical protein
MSPSRVRIPPSPPRRGGRAVECGGLENRYPSLGGSRVQIPPPPLTRPFPQNGTAWLVFLAPERSPPESAQVRTTRPSTGARLARTPADMKFHARVVARPLHTREVAGSIPAAPITEGPGNGAFLLSSWSAADPSQARPGKLVESSADQTDANSSAASARVVRTAFPAS